MRTVRSRQSLGHSEAVAKAVGLSEHSLHAFCRRHLGQAPGTWAARSGTHV